MDKILIYTDGSCLGNGLTGRNRGGAAYLIIKGNEEIARCAFGYRNTTNQRMELQAAISALNGFQDFCDVKMLKFDFFEISLYSDSAYLTNCANQHWWKNWEKNSWRNSKNESVVNQGLWEQLIPFFKKENIFFHKVKGHSGHHENEIVDKMAVEAAKKTPLE